MSALLTIAGRKYRIPWLLELHRSEPSTLSDGLARVKQMLPALAANDLADVGHADSVFVSERLLTNKTSSVAASDAHDITVFEPSRRNVLTAPDQLWMLGWAAATLGLHIEHVLAVCALEQVRVTDTRRIVAVVERVLSHRQRTVMQLVRKTMSGNVDVGTALDSEIPVARSSILPTLTSAGPDPAWPQVGTMLGNRAVLVDLRPESRRQRLGRRGAAARLRAIRTRRLRRMAKRQATAWACRLYRHRGVSISTVSRPRLVAQRGGFVSPELYHECSRRVA